jgi:hypothetical protein
MRNPTFYFAGLKVLGNVKVTQAVSQTAARSC